MRWEGGGEGEMPRMESAGKRRDEEAGRGTRGGGDGWEVISQ